MTAEPVTFRGRAGSLVGSPEATAIDRAMRHLAEVREEAMEEFPISRELRNRARAIRLHAIQHLDRLLSHFADQVVDVGGSVHFAGDAEEANRIVSAILSDAGAQTIVKSKSMVSEEIELNPHLEAEGFEVVESDLGEFIGQLGDEDPSHIIGPVLHMSKEQIGELFADRLGVEETHDPGELNQIARHHLRRVFLEADAGISGVNLGVAESGSLVLVTNEGNGRLTTTAPRVHIALMGMERVVSRWQDAAVILEVLARSATGQRLSVYTNVITGPRRPGDDDGPEELHVVIIDNGRADILSSSNAEILACIRCGACLNVCPVFRSVGGHAYGTVYSGPMGSIVTPGLHGGDPWWDLPFASTLCGACEEVCPVGIQIPSMLLGLRQQAAEEGRLPGWLDRGLGRYAGLADDPQRWRRATKWASWLTAPFATRGWLRRMPGPGRGWTASRDFPRPARESFSEWWRSNRET